jgi:hypothetical protein
MTRRRSMLAAINATDAEVFVYTGKRGETICDDVVRVRVDPSVTSIRSCISQSQEVGRGGAQRRPRGNWRTIFQQVRPFHNENQHPRLTKKDLRL